MRILIIEDDADHARIVRQGLSRVDMTCDVAQSGDKGERMLAAGKYDAVVLDLMLPDIGGMEILRRLRSRGDDTPVVVLSALGSTADRIAGLSAGADDYLPKPFSMDELELRIRAIVRRASPPVSGEVLSFRDLLLDTARRVASRNGREIRLTEMEYRLLEFLMRHPGRRMPGRFILEKVWDFDGSMTNVVEARIYAFRKKLNADGEQDLIENRRGLGYALR